MIRFGAYRIHVKAVPALAALLMLALLLRAGFWQLDRADDKRRMQLAQAARSAAAPVVLAPGLRDSTARQGLIYRVAEARGRYRSDKQYLLDNRTHNGVAGYHVLTPFILEDSELQVLINRGWLPVGTDRERLPQVTVTAAPLVEQGLIVAPPAAGLMLGSSGYDRAGWPKVVQQVDLQRMQTQIGAQLLPFVVRLSPHSEHGYVRDWHIRQGLSPERHLGYAVQWFALAVALVVLCVWVAVRRAPGDADAS